jgi:5S rRNA maturation endonuclease (ribonuclease M5)
MKIQKLKKTLNDKVESVFKKLNIDYEIISDNIYTRCPIHEGSDNNRGFSFSLTKGMWKCWTRNCQHEYRSDIFGLIQGVLSQQSGQQEDFKTVLKWCYHNFNIRFDSHSASLETEEEEQNEIQELINTFKSSNITITDKPIDINFNCAVPSNYFKDRGFNKQTLRYFSVGDCDENCIMKERSVIPIHDDGGELVVGLIGRSTKIYRTPKFLIYPKGFDKRNYLYNYHRAKDRARETSCMYLVEGQGDVWKLYEAGVKNVVGMFGKTLSEQQEKKIAKLGITHIIAILDNDQAGKEAVLQLYRQISRMYKITCPKISNKDIGEMKTKDIKSEILSKLRGTF